MKLAKNSFYNLISTMLPVIVNIVTIPIYITVIGVDRYGALTIAWLLLGYFGQADFGIGRAITQRISALGNDQADLRASAVFSAVVSITMFSLIGGVLIFGSAHWYFGGPFAVAPDLRAELLASIWILSLCNPVVAIIGVLGGSLMGLERFKLVSSCNLIANSAALILPLLTAIYFSPELPYLIGSALLARSLAGVLLSYGVWRNFFRHRRAQWSSDEFRRLLHFGSWIMVTALISPLMMYADRLIIGVVENAAAVAAYAIPFQIASRSQMAPLAVVQVLFPRFVAKDLGASLRDCRNYSGFIGLLYAPVVIGLMCLADPLMNLWLGTNLDQRSVLVAQIILAGFWFNTLASVPYAFIQARGNPRFTAIVHLCEVPFYFLILFALGQVLGLAGIALAFAVRCAADCLVLILKSKIAQGTSAMPMIGPAILVVLSCAASFWVQGWTLALISAAILTLASLAMLVLLSPPDILARIRSLPVLRSIPFARKLLGGQP